MNTASVVLKNHHVRIVFGTVGILLIPLIAMQFSNEVKWSASDFVIMGTLVFGTGLLLDLVIKRAGKYRAIAAIVVAILFVWIWAELAVGIFTHWGS
ncbi:MAG: hypothetical protein ABIR37_00490 [Candidatus Saccharimonadales bacterium]